MIVNRNDSTCRDCDGTLEIVDVDDARLTVFCLECKSHYKIEPHDLGTCYSDYFVPFSAQKAREWDEVNRDVC